MKQHFQCSDSAGRNLAVAMRILLPYRRKGMISKAKMPISMPKMPNGSAAPSFSTHVPTKNVHEKLTIERRQTTMTKQSPDTALYESSN